MSNSVITHVVDDASVLSEAIDHEARTVAQQVHDLKLVAEWLERRRLHDDAPYRGYAGCVAELARALEPTQRALLRVANRLRQDASR